MTLVREFYEERPILLIPKIAGLMSLSLGLTVVIGWHAENVSLVLIHRTFVAMQYNTALCFLLTGAALFAMASGWRTAAIMVGTTLVIISGSTLAEYLLEADIPIDDFFFPHPGASQEHLAARMSFITALCFVFSSAAILVFQFGHIWHYREAFVGILGIVIIGFGVIAVIGYIGGWEEAYGRSQNVGVAIHTAVGFIVVGFGFLAFVLYSTDWNETWSGWLPGLVGTAIVILSISLWQAFQQLESSRIEKDIAHQADLLEVDVGLALDTGVLSLARIADRWQARGGMSRSEWELDVASYLSDQSSLVTIGWLDKQFRVRWIEAIDESEPTRYIDYKLVKKRLLTLKRTGDRREFQLAAPIDLAGGRFGFFAFVPTYTAEGFDGFILGVFDITGLIDEILPKTFSERYGLAIGIGGEDIFVRELPGRQYVDRWSYTSTARFHSIDWEFRLWPKPDYLIGEYSSLPETVLAVGVAAAVLVSLSLYFAIASRNLSRRAEESEKWLSLILDSAGEGICGMNAQGRTTFVNKAAVSLLGYESNELIGNGQHALIHHHYPNGAEYPAERCKIGETLRYGTSCTEADEVFWKKDGTALPVEYTSRPIRGKNGKVSGAVIVFRDIAQRKTTDAERERLIAMLKRSNEELDSFAHIASHDLKEPMRAIHNHSRFLMEDYQDKLGEDGVKRLGRLGYLTQRMERLISDLLYFSRLGRDELSTKSTDLNGVIIDIKNTLSDVLEEQNVFVSVPRPLPIVDCDVVRVTELFRNLIENAIKYNKSAEKRVEIGYDDSDGYVFHVKDNGIGIDLAYHADIFRIFKRLHSEKEYAAGTGAGLTFVKKIVEQHKGKIWLESAEGEGTTFFFTLKEEPR